ncbi:MAG TPA: site-specific integrase [Chlamydiales bacterium]|nr:site-specific integrase [Chlamydiales bacterium]
MAFIEKRTAKDGTVSYRAQIRIKGQASINETFPNKRLAEAWAKKTETEIKEGQFFKTYEARKHTVAQMIDRYLETIMPRKPKSTRKQTAQLTWWKQQIGHKFLVDVTPALLREQMDLLATGEKSKRGPGTITRYCAAFSHCLSVAAREWEWIEINPMSKVTRPREPRGRLRFLSPDERTRLLQACKESSCPDLLLIVVLGLSTGARLGELLNLRWVDVGLDQRKLVFRETKNGETRSVGVTNTAYTLLSDHAAKRTFLSPLVFPSRKDFNKPLNIRTAWETALKKAQIEDFVFHSLRHSAASELAMSGASLVEIAEILGHKSLSMVRRYSHLAESHTTKVLERMTEKVFGGTS